MLRKLLKAAGLTKRNRAEVLGYDLEDQAVPLMARVKGYTMLAPPPLITLYQQVAHCEKYGIEGEFVECGVWKGGAVGLMALANMALAKERRILRLFDAFDDICEPDPAVDGSKAVGEVEALSGRRVSPTGKLEPVKGIYDAIGGHGVLDEVRALLQESIGYDPASIRYHKGWFQDTLPEVAPAMGKIAILRLDGDWYASTKVCLEHLYDKVVPGGFIIVDDYGCYEGCAKAVDEFIRGTETRPFISHVDQACRYWIKGE
jgi:O-methyltransferase